MEPDLKTVNDYLVRCDQNGCRHTGKYPPQAEGCPFLFRYLVFLFESLQCFLRIQLVLLIVAQDKMKAFFIRGSHTLYFGFRINDWDYRQIHYAEFVNIS